MKKIILSLLLGVFFSITSFSQVTFEHSYSTDILSEKTNAFISDSGLNYYTLDKITNNIYIYDVSHNLIKTINIVPNSGSYIESIYYMSDKLFNSDNLIEFILVFRTNLGSYTYEMTLYNENATILQQIGTKEVANVIKDTNNNFKLITSTDKSTTFGDPRLFDVYSLSGTLSISQQNLLNKSIIAYPNPADNIITITNLLENDGNEILSVFDMNGKKVLEKKIDKNSSELNLNVENLKSGLYLYKIKDKTYKFIKK